MSFGDLRSALHSNTPYELGEDVYFRGVWHYVLDYLRLHEPTLTWHSNDGPSQGLACTHLSSWRLTAGSLTLLSHEHFELGDCQRAWSLIPAWQSLGTWWAWADGALAHGEIEQTLYDAPHELLTQVVHRSKNVSMLPDSAFRRALDAAEPSRRRTHSTTHFECPRHVRAAAWHALWSIAYTLEAHDIVLAGLSVENTNQEALYAVYHALNSITGTEHPTLNIAQRRQQKREHFETLFTQYVLHAVTQRLFARRQGSM